MTSRIELQTMLEQLLGSRNVYFQPPESLKLRYPAIVYSLDALRNDNANNSVYKQSHTYKITVVDTDPDSETVVKISQNPRCRFDRSYQANNLNHFVFTLQY